MTQDDTQADRAPNQADAGRDRPPARRPRRWVALVVLVLGAATSVAAITASRSGTGPASPQAPPVRPRAGRDAQEHRTPIVPLEPTRTVDFSAPPPAARGPVDAAQMTQESIKEEVFAVVRQLMAEFPASTDPIGLMGTAHHQLGNQAEAMKWWQKVLDRNPRRADAYAGMAGIALKNGDYDTAITLCTKAAQIAPNLPGVHQRWAEALLEQGKPREAAAELQQEVRNHPDASQAYCLLGRAWSYLGDYQKAVENYTEALRLQPEAADACYGLSVGYARLRDTEKAGEYSAKFRAMQSQVFKSVRKDTREATKLTELVVVAALIHTQAAVVYKANGRPHEAERHWQRAAELDPKARPCRQHLVELYMQAGRPQDALARCRQLCQIEPGNRTYHLNTGVVLARLEQFEAAEAAVRRSLELDPDHAPACRSLLTLLLGPRKNPPEALALARRLVQREPAALNYSLLAQACRLNGDLPGARAALEQAIRLAPDDAALRAAYRALQEGG